MAEIEPRIEYDPQTLRTALEYACDSALSDYRMVRNRDAYQHAYGVIDGIYQGMSAMSHALGGELWTKDPESVARQVTSQYSEALLHLARHDRAI